MVHQIRPLATKSEEWNATHEFHMVEGAEHIPTSCPLTSSMLWLTQPIHTINKKQELQDTNMVGSSG